MYTLMHISDLHRSSANPISNDELLSGLLSDQERFECETPEITRPQAIIVSGDLVQGLSLGAATYPDELKAQYDEALDLLIRLADAFTEGDRSRVIIVPGNHDVDWNRAFTAMEQVDFPSEKRTPNTIRSMVSQMMSRLLFSETKNTFRAQSASHGKNIDKLLSMPNTEYRWSWEGMGLYRISDRSLYENRFAHFSEMYNRFYDGSRLAFGLDPSRYWNGFELDEGRVLVCAFNSCANNDCFSNFGDIPFDAIAQCHMELPRLERHRLKLAVWHHSVQGRPQDSDFIDSDTIKILIDRGFRLGLHGHQHKSDASPFSFHTSDKEVMALISAGSLCAGRKELPMGFYRQYNIIQVNDSYSGARVHVREMQIRGVFTAGRLIALGGTSFGDLSWTDVPHATLVNTGLGGGALISEIENIERLIAQGFYEDAITQIRDRSEYLQDYGRKLLVKALFKSEKWDELKTVLTDPQNDEELALLLRSLITLRLWSEGEQVLERAKESGEFNETTVRELVSRFKAERRASA
jgi:hypothetical protein